MSIQNSIQDTTFWGLKENWWKQVYDGKYHEFGKEVFDKGLHDGPTEPGYYNSIKMASEYASNLTGMPLTIEIYTKIHSLACQHFKDLKPSVINVEANQVNEFRDAQCDCFKNLTKDSYYHEDSTQTEARRLSFVLLNSVRHYLMHNSQVTTKTGSKEELDELPSETRERVIKHYTNSSFLSRKGVNVQAFFDHGIPTYENAIKSTQKVTEQLEATQKKLNLSQPFASLKINSSGEEIIVYINYNYKNSVDINQVVIKLIDDYNKKIESLPSNHLDRSNEEKELALQYIAELFQNLEWLHPFFDGQGRTDLVLLAKLLSENGFNPAILYNPYFSTFEPLDNWVSYLKEGMEQWKKL